MAKPSLAVSDDRAAQTAGDIFFAKAHVSLDHALPYRVMFAELRAQRPSELTNNVTDTALILLIEAAEAAYQALQDAKQRGDDPAAVNLMEEKCKVADAPLKRLLHAMDSSALCLSGGGIRSATFSLGILQGLARCKLLENMRYLSTVSGGGYIGTWLMAWAKAEGENGWATVNAKLAEAAPTAGDPEPGPVRHLRDYSSYLTPTYGFSLDTATLVIIILRNLILNWLMFAPTIIFVLCLPVFFSWWAWKTSAHGSTWSQPMLEIATALLCVGVVFAMFRVLWHYDDKEAPVKTSSSTLEFLCLTLPVMMAAWLVMLCWFHGDGDQRAYKTFITFDQIESLGHDSWNFLKTWHTNAFSHPAPGYFWLCCVAFCPMLFAWVVRTLWQDQGGARLPPRWKRALAGFACIPASLTFAGLLWGVAVLFSGDVYGIPKSYLPHFMTVVGLPLVAALIMTGFAVQEGMLSKVETEEEREWWARGAGLLMFTGIGWLVVTGFSLGSDVLMRSGAGLRHVGQPTQYWGSLSAGVTLLLSWLTAKMGGSKASGSGLRPVQTEDMGKLKTWLSKNGWLPQAASAVMIALILFLLGTAAAYWRIGHDPLHADEAIAVVCLLVAGVANYYVNANTFSLHGMYRMRLVRAYLGASNMRRRPNPFTNFDPKDDMALTFVDPAKAPLHVINCNLNLVDTQVLSWQQRKGESFTFSRVYSGSWRTGYVKTSEFAGINGIKLGTAMAISGAAASPNMGYNSSPLVTFLMTLFNARLGWWLPNAKMNIDKPKKLKRNSPTLSLYPLINEAIGRTDDRFPWVQLSDGGHFENLGIYEMVMRRAKTIVVVDADADEKCRLGDLGNAIRKIEIDLGVPIEMEEVKMDAGEKKKNHYCAIGKVRYSCVDPALSGGEPKRDGWDATDGVLVYIKPQLNGSEPKDVLAYAWTHKTFPHETTVDQFFNESQFESYRHLGSWVMDVLTTRKDGNPCADGSLRDFVDCCAARVKEGPKPKNPATADGTATT